MTKPDTGAATEDHPAEEAETPEKPAAKAKPEEDAEPKKPKGDGPPVDSPRWTEVYGRWKDTERKLQERDQDVDALRDHNRALEERLNRVEISKADKTMEPEPDPEVDPAGYKKWVDHQRAKDKQAFDRQREIDRHETQVEIQKELHPDYLEMIKVAERDMAKDKDLRAKIWGSGNPAKAAYEHAVKKTAKETEDEKEDVRREKAKQQTDTEGAGEEAAESQDAEEDKLSEAEQRVVRNLFPDLKPDEARKKYQKQKKAMGGN